MIAALVRIFTVLLALISFSGANADEARSCSSALEPAISVKPKPGMGVVTDEMIADVRAEITAALDFIRPVLSVPQKIEVELTDRSYKAVFSFDSTGFILLLPYTFSDYRNRQWVAKSARHSATVRLHELGHAVFEANFGGAGVFIKNGSVQANALGNIYVSFHEFFADLFAIVYSGNPLGPYAASQWIDTSPQKIQSHARNIFRPLPPGELTEINPHVRLARAARALAAHPVAQEIFLKNRAVLARVVFDAISRELRELQEAKDLDYAKITTEELNARFTEKLENELKLYQKSRD